MAGSFSVKFNGTLTSSLHSDSFGSVNPVTISQSGQGLHAETVTVGTTIENMPGGDVSGVGRLFLKNLDTGNFVSWGPNNAADLIVFGRLDPTGELWMDLSPNLGLIKWKADTAPCKVQMKLFEA